MKYLIIFLFFFILNGIKAQVQSNAGLDREICLNDTLNVIGSGLNIGDTGSYQWIDVNNGKIVSSSSNLFLPISSLTPKSYQLRVEKISNGQTYTAFDTFNLTVLPLPTFSFKGIPPICYNDGALQLTSNRIAVGKAGYNPNLTDSFLHYFQKVTPSWITGGPKDSSNYVYDFQKFTTNSQLPFSRFRDTICYEYKDPKGCYAMECKGLRIFQSPIVELKNGDFCQDNEAINLSKLVLKPFNKTGGIESYRCISLPPGSGLNKDSIVTLNTSVNPNFYELEIGKGMKRIKGVYVIEYGFKDVITGCVSYDTCTLVIVEFPALIWSSIPPFCFNDKAIVLDSFVRDSASLMRLNNSKWSCVEFAGSRDINNPNVADKLNNSIINSKHFDPSKGSGNYLLKVTYNSNYCALSDSMIFLVNGLPIIQIDIPDTVCANNTVQLTNIIPSGNVGNWSGIGVNGNKFNASISPQSSFYHGPYKVKYTYQNPLTKCYNSDSGKIIIKSLPKITPQYKVVPKTSFDVEFSISDYKFIDTNTYKCLWVFGNGDSSHTYTPGRIHFNDSGLQTVIIYLNNGNCINTDTLHFTLDYRNTSINMHTISTHIYPNPTSEIVNICADEDVIFTLYDLNGKPLLSKSLLKGEKGNISVAGFAKGIYLIKIESGFYFVWKKLIIE